MSTEDDVRRLNGQGLSIRQIAKQLGLSRMKVHRTIAAALESELDDLAAEDDDEGDELALFDADADYEVVAPFTFVGIVEGDRERRQDVRCLDANGRSASMLDVYRANYADEPEGRGYLDDLERQIVEAGYRRIVGPDDYLRWVDTPPVAGERVA